ncbi:PAS domain-containing sensor histidine kinase [Haloplanus pelagicus]|jgi:PAS domain S-box-containing protein|uniref:PAS domain-containing sensor histidine kinase n=1 Tax=Haloplanus pelagicus TaxID=2949995 RepID=UPI00203D1B04|nr:HAMP domain-containing sensor histidine kinase [Haloplanus sp. HW8-1]
MSRQTGPELDPAYDDLHTGVALYDPDTGAVLDANDRLESIFGFTTDELRERRVATYTANTHAFSAAEFLARLRASAAGDPQEFVWRVKRADGELVWVRLYLSRRASGGRQDFVRAEVRDITQSYHTERREELFWRLLRHNLRNGANVLTGHGERIAAHAETERIRESAAVVRDTAVDLGRMAESVTEIEQAMRTDGERRRCVAAAIDDVADDLRAEHPAASVEITERERMWTDVDDSFVHAVSHALENAIVHGDGPRAAVRVTVGPSPNTGRVQIRIEDDNPPIPESELGALDDRAETTATSHGTGVGLFVMKWCIESLGGELEIETGTRRGNAVCIYLPPREPSNDAG